MSRARIRQGDVVDAAAVRDAQPEQGFQRQVVQLLELGGWLYFHDVDSRKNRRGLPDLIAVRRRRLLFVELKSGGGMLTDEQADWLHRLAALGSSKVEVYVWRPADIDDAVRVLA